MSLLIIKLIKPLLCEVHSWSCQIHLSYRESSDVSTYLLTGQLISVTGTVWATHQSRNKNTHLYQPLKHARPAPSELLTARYLGSTVTSPLMVLLLFTLTPNTLGSEGASSNRPGAEAMICTPYVTSQSEEQMTYRSASTSSLAFFQRDVT